MHSKSWYKNKNGILKNVQVIHKKAGEIRNREIRKTEIEK